jgi:hypothetical protein
MRIISDFANRPDRRILWCLLWIALAGLIFGLMFDAPAALRFFGGCVVMLCSVMGGLTLGAWR